MGTQEENTVTRCTALAQLLIAADPLPEKLTEYLQSNTTGISYLAGLTDTPKDSKLFPPKYRKGFHLPPAGVSVCKTRFLDAPASEQFDSFVLSMASADFREKEPHRPYVEGEQFGAFLLAKILTRFFQIAQRIKMHTARGFCWISKQ